MLPCGNRLLPLNFHSGTSMLHSRRICCGSVVNLLTCDLFTIDEFLGSHCYWYTVYHKNVPPLACYNFDAHEWILIFFGRNVTDKVGSQKTLYYATSNNLCSCTVWQNGETRKSHFSLNWIVLHTQCTCVLSSWKKKLSSVMCLIASNICWDIKISH